MIIVWLIGLMLCAIVFYLAKNCKVEKKQRKSVSQYWDNVPWEECTATIAYPRFMYILFILFAMIPIFNIIMCVVLVVLYIQNLRGPYYNYGSNLVAARIVLSGELVKWLTKAV